MALMTVRNDSQPGRQRDHRSQPRWSADKKMDAVLQLLRGERWRSCRRNSRSRRIGWPPGATTSWKPASKASRCQRADRILTNQALKRAERKIGQHGPFGIGQRRGGRSELWRRARPEVSATSWRLLVWCKGLVARASTRAFLSYHLRSQTSYST